MRRSSALRRVLATGLLLALGLLVAAGVLLALAFQDQPLITHRAAISIEQIDRARQIVDHHTPGKLGDVRGPRALVLSEEDLDLLVNYAARQFLDTATQVVLEPGAVVARASIPVRANPFGGWINVDAWLRETDGLPVFQQLRIGRVTVPNVIADWLVMRFLDRLGAASEVKVAGGLLRNARFGRGEMRLVYDWRPDDARRVLSALMPPTGGGRLKAYSDRLVEVAAALPAGQPVSLAALLPPLFELARERGAAAGGDASTASANGTAGVPDAASEPGTAPTSKPSTGANPSPAAEENRAAIIALAFYANGVGLGAIVPAANDWPKPAPHTVRLSARDDSPLHFLVSAAIAAAAGSPLADAIGVYKEVDDSRHGSGFSFNDLAHDRAGTRFGELAIQDPATLQRRIAAGLTERDFMPDVADLPEDMPEAVFKARYGGVGSPAYERMRADIEARVAGVPLFR